MRHIKNYNFFINENKNINLKITIDELLSILDEEVDIFKLFNINKDQVKITDDIDVLYENAEFNKKIDKNDLKKGKLEDTSYDEVLLDDSVKLKFFFLNNKGTIEIEEPKFIILQYNKSDGTKSEIKGYQNIDKINKFYQKLTDSTIELSNGKDTYIYQTSNGGNNWEMKNVQMENDDMKGELDVDQLNDMIKKLNLKIIK